jgi:phosphoglucosamine mutase
MGKYFGTDGIRGKFGDEIMCPEFAYKVGVALGEYLEIKDPKMPHNVVIGRDTRMSGPALMDSLIQGFNSLNVNVYDVGIIPTPAVALSIIEQSAHLGIAITASHNPASDNGIKLFNDKGHKLSPDEELKIEALIDSVGPHSNDLPLPKSYPLDGAAYYINYQRSLMDQGCMTEWTIVLDTANGATAETSPEVFKRWNAKLHLIGDNPDGDNINSGVGSESPEKMQALVRKLGADIGIAHDGDGDRVVICDHTGHIVDGDILLGIFAIHALQVNALGNKTLVTTIHSNIGLDRAVEAAGGRVIRVDVGDRNVAEKMREVGSNFGGESSGHLIFSDFSTTGDGLLAASKLIDLMCKTNQTLAQLSSAITLFPQQTANLKVQKKIPLDELPDLQATIQKIESALGDEGRVLIRYSGTEPKIRLLIEGKDASAVSAHMNLLEKAVRGALKVIGD